YILLALMLYDISSFAPFSADVAHSLGARTVLAIDVGQQKEWNTWNYGDSLSGWWLLWNRLNPWSEKVKVFSLWHTKFTYVFCVKEPCAGFDKCIISYISYIQ
ncbi:neuropathy target esterase, partial [Pelobates cultripes]